MRCTACNNGLVRVPRSSPADPDVAPCSRCTGGIIAPDFECFVPGIPRPQGSKTRTRYGGMRESSKYVKAWRDTVRGAAEGVVVGRLMQTANKLGMRLQGPLVLGVELLFPRPKAHFQRCIGRTCTATSERLRTSCPLCNGDRRMLRDRAPSHVTCKPDTGKCLRAIEDSLTDAGVWNDDSQVVGYAGFPLTCKRYANPGEQPGARIRVWKL